MSKPPEDELIPPPPPPTTTTPLTASAHLYLPKWSKEALTTPLTTTSSAEREAFMMMDLDLDLDASWSFDHVFSAVSSEQPFSPLWAFSDENTDDKTAGNVGGGGTGVGFYPRFISYAVNPDSANENTPENEDKRKASPPILSLTPIDYLDGSCIIKERMTQALRSFKDSTEQHVLAQVWAPVKNGGGFVLTTSGQPFVLDTNSNGLHQYRMMSLMYNFTVEGETNGLLGLPGRVFRQRLPEWTPNVQYYSSKEFPRLDHALNYNVRGTLALPVFEPSGQSCIGVLELIMTSQKIHYAPEVDRVCKALEAVNLKSSEILDPPNTQICNEGRQNALVEILEILTVVCETLKLPLAQTWVPCRHRSVLAYGGGLKKSCSSFDGSCMGQVCMSTTDVAFYVVDAHMWGFREACVEHHLRRGQGVAGRAFALRSSCFCADIAKFCKTEYPLVHYARMFGLSSCFAICLRSTHTGDDDYILEFFLPADHKDQQTLLGSLLETMKPHFKSLRSASGKDLEDEWKSVEIVTAPMDEKLDLRPESIPISRSATSASGPVTLKNVDSVHFDSLEEQQIVEGYNASNGGGNVGCSPEVENVVSLPETKHSDKKPGRKRGKAEKTISLEVLQQYFAGSLKDAAKSLGVCPTTMKRICRQHGISRWPSRKINKVNRSLSKLKRVIESVQGAEGTFTLTSLATSSLPVAVGDISWPASGNGSPGSTPAEFLEGISEFYAHKTPGTDEHAEASNQMLGFGVFENELRVPEKNGFLHGEVSRMSKTGSDSREESTGTPTTEDSWQGSPGPGNESSPHNELVVSAADEHGMKVGGSMDLANRPSAGTNLSAVFSTPDVFVSAQPQEPFRGMLTEDAGSSQDLRNLCPLGEGLFDERLPEHSWTDPQCSDSLHKESKVSPADRTPKFSARPEMRTITIKATYREDIIRFRLSLDSGVIKLKEEVAKRLKLELGTFDIKYLDDDHEWVLIACDTDLRECIDMALSSGSNMIRLLVNDLMTLLGSSCESTGE